MSNDTSKNSQRPPLGFADYISSAHVKAPWGALMATVAAVLSFVFAQLVGQLVVPLYPHLMHWSEHRTEEWLKYAVTAQFWYVLISELLTLAILWLFWRGYVGKGVRRALGLARRLHWKDLGFAVAGIVVYYFLYLAVLAVAMSATHINTNQSQDVGFNDVNGAMNLIMTFVSLVILPPIVEEIMFRGFLFSGLSRTFGVRLGIILTSVLFAAPHLLEADAGGLLWTAGIDTFVLSLVLCYLRVRTGALYAGIGVHMLKNTVAFVTLYIVHVR